MSCVLVLLLTVGMFPTALAAEAPAPIAAVSAPAGPVPQLGQKTAEATHPGDGYTVTTRWSSQGSPLPDGTLFVPGTYTETAVATAAEGRSFAPSVSFTLGGETRTLSPQADGTLVFEKVWELKQETIDSVRLDFPTPRAGEKALPFTRDAEGENYRAEGQWKDAPETFEAGKTYTLTITVLADEGWTFAEGVPVADAEGHVYAHTSAADQKSLTFSVQRLCAEAPAPSGSTDPSVPQTDSKDPSTPQTDPKDPSDPVVPGDDKIPENQDPSKDTAPTQITDVTFTPPETPAAGTTAMVFFYDVEGDPYDVFGFWKEDGAIMDDKTVFEAGKSYTLSMTVQSNPGFVFANSLKVNGKDHTLTGNPDGFTVDKIYTIEAPEPVAAIKRDGAEKLYETLDAAIEDAVSGETIRVLADTSTAWTQGYYMGKSLTFQLDGHNVTFPTGF